MEVTVVRNSIIVGALAVLAMARTQGTDREVGTARIPPYWAYAVNPPDNPAARPADNTPRHVPGSVAAFTRAQVTDLFNAPDWHPDHHATMPDIVAQGRKPGVFACGYCHLPNGQGRPENAAIAGLPADYILQQIADFRSGRRRSSEPKHLPTVFMTGVATNANEQEVQSAAGYFSRLTPQPWIRVVETSTVPKTQVSGWMLVSSGAAGFEPIGERIIETPENLERTELRDDTSGFVAYVPVGSIRLGESLVKTGGSGKTIQCSICHGPDLKGLGNVPSIAGRSPSYVVRQLFDIQHGTRAGVAAELMKAPVARLTLADMVSIAAYTASLRP